MSYLKLIRKNPGRDKLNICVNGCIMRGHDVLMILDEMLSHLGLPLFNRLMHIVISSSLVGDKKYGLRQTITSYIFRTRRGTLWNFTSQIRPIFTKKELKPPTIAFLSVIYLPFTRNLEQVEVFFFLLITSFKIRQEFRKLLLFSPINCELWSFSAILKRTVSLVVCIIFLPS